MLQNIRAKFMVHPRVYTAIIGLVLVVGVIILFTRGGTVQPKTVEAKRGEIRSEVSVTGRVKAAQNVELSFERGGTVAGVYADVGTYVVPGQIIAVLSNADLSADRDAARANLMSVQAGYDEVKNGARSEDVAVTEAQYASAAAAVSDAENNMSDKYADAYTKADDAVRNYTDQFFSSPRSVSPTLSIPSASRDAQTQVEVGRARMESLLNEWKALNLKTNTVDAANTAKSYLVQVSSFLDSMAAIVNAMEASSLYSQTTVDGYKTDVATARTNVNTAIVNLTAAVEKLRTAENAEQLAKNQLTLKIAPARAEDLAQEEARVAQAKAQLAAAEAALAKTYLRAPFYGIVTRQDAKRGQVVVALSPVAGVISQSKFEIEADVPEADIATLKIGQSASVSLDAYSSDVIFGAHVTKINPAETMIDGVPTYKTTFQFDSHDERVRSGMTANIDVLADKREDAISVPYRAVYARGTKRYVRKQDGAKFVEVEVKTGLRGSDGYVEIVEGLSEGDVVQNGNVALTN